MDHKSWKTTAGALAAAIGTLLAILLPALGVEVADGKIDEAVGAILTIVGIAYFGFTARDDNVTSEGRVAPKKANRSPLWILALLPAAMVGFPGCSQQRVGGVVTSDSTGYRSEGSVRNALVVDAQGQTTQDYAVEAPSAVIAGSQGVENYSAVPFGSVSVQLPDGTLLVASVPNDFMAESVDITHPGGETVRLSGVSVMTSDVIVARAGFLREVEPIIAGWTDQQKQALVAELEAQARFGDAAANALLPFIKALIAGG